MASRIAQVPMLVLLIIGLLTQTILAAEKPAGEPSQSAAAQGAVLLLDSKVAWQTFTVDKTYNNTPFKYQIKLLAQRNGYRVYELKYPSPVRTPLAQNNTVPAEYYLPDWIMSEGNAAVPAESSGQDVRAPGFGIGPMSKRPAVICLHILDGNDVLTDMVCSALARRGVPAIMFKLPYYGQRGTANGPLVLINDPKLFAQAIAQAGEDFRRTIDLLASRPEIDPGRIGATGISLGGIVAATAAGGEPRINRAAFVLSGGDLLKIIHHARETRPISEMLQKLSPAERSKLEAQIAAVDPLRFAPALKEKARQGKIMMINAEQDEVIPRVCTDKLAAALGLEDQIIWIKGLGHYTSMAKLPETLHKLADYFARDLPPGTKMPIIKKDPNSPLQALAGLMEQVAAIIDAQPDDGRCHVLDVQITATPNGQKSPYKNSPLRAPTEGWSGEDQGEGTQKGRFRLVLGSQKKFAVFCKLPVGSEISLGQDEYPWLATGGKEVLEGTANPGPALKDPLELLDPRQVQLLKMLAGLLRSAAMTPEVLERLIVVKDDGVAEGARAIRISVRQQNISGAARLLLKPDENTPISLTYNFPGAQMDVKFLQWQINAPALDSFFQAPADLPRRAVDQNFLYTLFSTSLKYTLPTMELR